MSEAAPRKNLRTRASIAHVDHGKITLVDGLLRLAGAVRANRSRLIVG